MLEEFTLIGTDSNIEDRENYFSTSWNNKKSAVASSPLNKEYELSRNNNLLDFIL